MTPGPRPQAVVLDTNVALALWLFRDARLNLLHAALRDGSLLWLQTRATQDELLHEIRPERCARFGLDRADVLAAVEGVPARVCNAAPTCLVDFPRLRCSDPDDQVFIDLALAERAAWLLTRDKALLKLRHRARQHGLCIVEPQAWRGTV